MIAGFATAWVLLGAAAAEPPRPQEESLLERWSREVAQVGRTARQGVVAVRVRRTLEVPLPAAFGVSLPHEARFSGVALEGGYVLTAASGVVNAESLEVTPPDGEPRPVRVLGIDHAAGVAVLACEDLPCTPLEWSEEPVEEGSFALVCGNAFGMSGSLFPGVVTGAGRAARVAGRDLYDLYTVSAPAFPGDGGAAVVDARGRLIGIVVGGQSPVVRSRRWQEFVEQMLEGSSPTNVALVVRADVAREAAERIVRRQPAGRGWVGLVVRPDEEGWGLVVREVQPGGPAERAGLHVGDVILQVDGAQVRDARALRRLVWRLAGRRVRVAVDRHGERVEIEVEIGQERHEDGP